ncbi:inner-membrane translocator [Pyrolobus fumarii 1A]|uniref:Inner-membrane translocator n=1 Tax=Pyrolobus fumarii (strain DSM 11204 / 1A) TaxID=694429 RepID=G0ECR6_PYRF1|nr:ABC transporter permease [Pyrolobus fumarii]AEM39636.1 inner-membrane translocator [Pyrolobus fumarii 1A]
MVDLVLLAGTVLRSAAAVVLAVLAEAVSERAGVVNLGLEGIMLIGGLVGVVVSLMTGSVEAGVLAGMLAGIAYAALYAVLVNGFKLNQIVAGVAVYMAGVSISTMFGEPYSGLPLPQPLRVGGFEVVVLVAYTMPVLVWLLLRATGFDARLRAVGDNPFAADMMGVDVARVRTAAVLVNGMLAGYAGALFVMIVAGRWRPMATAGIGWLSIALTPMTLWEPLLAYVPALVYGFSLVAKSLWLQWLPDEAREATPYIAVLIAAAITVKLVKGYVPRSLGRVYVHGVKG